ncbi:MAG: acetate--CoA ligase family protein [Candidatus Hodarchaeota archaeon]
MSFKYLVNKAGLIEHLLIKKSSVELILSDPALKALFYPDSVAVIGASSDPSKIGNELLKNLIDNNFNGKIYPVNPKSPEILGLKAYSSMESIPNDVDLALFAIPAKFVPDMMIQCRKRNVKTSIIISGGFKETGTDEGRILQNNVINIAQKAGIRIVGPNCQGINNPSNGLVATFAGKTTLPGPIGVISQSGTVSAVIQCWAERDGIGISKCVNLGNKSDINENDLIQYLKDDENTKVIALYLEGLADADGFIEVIKDVAKTKPIVILKEGKTEAGFKAMFSHTGSLAGNAAVFDAALKQIGAINAKTLEEWYDLTLAFAFITPPKGPGFLIIESTGGAGILASDMADQLGFTIEEPEEETLEKLREILPDICIFSNPFDLTTVALDPVYYKLVVQETMHDEKYHSFMLIFGDPIRGAAEVTKEITEITDKSIIVVFCGGGDVEVEERKKIHSMGIPAYQSPERAVVALNALVQYSQFLRDTPD